MKSSVENDLYGVLGCVLHAVSGRCLLEEQLHQVNPKWQTLDWCEYTDIIRKWQRRVMTTERLENVVDQSLCKNDESLRTIISQLGLPRRERMCLEEIDELVRLHEETMGE